MKIRAIGLNNVRRFTRAVRIADIGDGLNILCEPNEYGKSTLFDALQAVFFVAHGSQKQEVKALRPHAGGAPEVSVEVETEDGLHRVTKRWLSRPIAEVHRDGRLIAQADEAEAWISGLITGGDGGPAGLLWVRQGLTGLDDGSDKERKAAQAARRGLLSSVTGEVEAMTGGRRMDSALARCRKELDVYATAGNRKPAKGGPWRDAIDAVEELEARRDRLAETTRALHEQLGARKRKRRELAEIEAPEEAAARKARLEEAESRLDTARQHADQLDAAAQAVKMKGLEVANRFTALDRIRGAHTELAEAQKAHAATQEAAGIAGRAEAAAQAGLAEAKAALETARQEAATAEATRRKAERRQQARAGAAGREKLAERLRQAEAARDRLAELAPRSSRGPDPATLHDIEQKAAELALARSLRDSAAPRLEMHYAAGAAGRVRLGGQPLAGGKPLAIPDGADLTLEGLGTLHIRPGAGGRDDGRAEAAERALGAALAAVDADTPEAARAAAADRAEAAETVRELRARMEALAPDGLDTLRAEIAAIPEAAAEDENLPDLATAEALAAAAAERLTAVQAARDTAGEQDSGARSAAATARAEETAAAGRLARAQAALERLGTADEARVADDLTRAQAALEAAEAAHAALRRDAPDLEAAQSAVDRARSADRSAQDQAARLRVEIAGLEARIAASSGEAVEEELAETEGRLQAAQAQLARIAREVQVLQRLEAALDTARTASRERYFEPVAAELKPLLSLLWPDARLNWGDDTLLPDALIRDHIAEPVEILSGGTREQLALLVRLAFARMLARGGRHAPVILDDALVFTDDDRIERMFDALHRQAGDLQIIVLSCRQRAFRALGGHTLRLEPDEPV